MKDKISFSVILFGIILVPVSLWLIMLRTTEANYRYILSGVFIGLVLGLLMIYKGKQVYEFKIEQRYLLLSAVGMSFVLRLLLTINENIAALVLSILVFIAITILIYLSIQLWLDP